MEPVISRQSDGTLTISITLPAGTGGGSLLRLEEQIQEAVNAVGLAANPKSQRYMRGIALPFRKRPKLV